MASMPALIEEDKAEVLAVFERPLLAHRPQAVLDEAATAAKALRGVIEQKPKKVVMNGEQYLEFEDWQTVARFYGITAGEVGEPEYVHFGDTSGFKATSVARSAEGRELSRATAYCLDDEEKWSTRTKYEWVYVTRSGGHSVEDPGRDEIVWEDNPAKPGKKRPVRERIATGEERVPLFQMASMAQTRANAKAMRNVLSWVVVLAGYRSTPAEELDNLTTAVEREREHGSDDAPAKPASAPPAAAAPAKPAGELPKSDTKPTCPACKSDRSVICTTSGVWTCAKSKGGCSAELARR